MIDQVERIRQMELCFLQLQQAWVSAPERIRTDPMLRTYLQILQDYQACGLWLEDYSSDESGLLPVDLQRGVLSQDGLYNLLQAISEWESESHENL